MGISEKLLQIQSNLKAPKNQYNDFGKYKYRSCEDILEGLKPLLARFKATIAITDEIVQIGERYYVKATVTLFDVEDNASVSVSAYAREDENKKGMDLAQVTGSVSSYARKYALNGLFAIDDTKDSDATNEAEKPTQGKVQTQQQKQQQQHPKSPTKTKGDTTNTPPTNPPQGDDKNDIRCADCGDPVTPAVKAYCHKYLDRFKGKVVCQKHQTNYK